MDRLAIKYVEIRSDKITAEISDGRTISIPISWFPKLASASKNAVSKFEISPSGYGIHWPDLDEDISIKSFID